VFNSAKLRWGFGLRFNLAETFHIVDIRKQALGSAPFSHFLDLLQDVSSRLLCHHYVSSFESNSGRPVRPNIGYSRAVEESSTSASLPQFIYTEIRVGCGHILYSSSEVVELIDHTEVSIFGLLVRYLHLVIHSLIADRDRITRGQVGSYHLQVCLIVNQFTFLSRPWYVSKLPPATCVTSCNEKTTTKSQEATTDNFHACLYHDVVEHA